MVMSKRLLSVALILVVVFIVVAAVFQGAFKNDFRLALGSDIDYMMLCDLGTQRCRTVERSKHPAFPALTKELSQAGVQLPPSKAQIVDEKVLRIGRGLPVSGTYSACYRVVRYVGADEVFINDVAMNAECTRFERFSPGFLAVPARILSFFGG
jgi:hypothetical protein